MIGPQCQGQGLREVTEVLQVEIRSEVKQHLKNKAGAGTGTGGGGHKNRREDWETT